MVAGDRAEPDGARRYARHAAHEVQVEGLEVTFFKLGANSSVEPVGDEAAAATGMTVGALEVATHRAVAALRRMLTARETHGH